MAKGKIKMGPNIVRNPEEPKSQSKVNPALSYGQRTGDTYVNKSEPPKKKKKTPPMRGGTVARSAKPVPPKAGGDELKRLKENKKSYANYLKGGGNKITAPKVKSTNTIQSLIVKKPSPKRPGGR